MRLSYLSARSKGILLAGSSEHDMLVVSNLRTAESTMKRTLAVFLFTLGILALTCRFLAPPPEVAASLPVEPALLQLKELLAIPSAAVDLNTAPAVPDIELEVPELLSPRPRDPFCGPYKVLGFDESFRPILDLFNDHELQTATVRFPDLGDPGLLP